MSISSLDLDHEHTGEGKDMTNPDDIPARQVFGRKVKKEKPIKRKKFRQTFAPIDFDEFRQQDEKRKDIH